MHTLTARWVFPVPDTMLALAQERIGLPALSLAPV
jgi:hypothetical protein